MRAVLARMPWSFNTSERGCFVNELLNWHIVAAVLSGVCATVSGVLYITDMVRGGDTKPNAVSFFLWTVLAEVALIGQLEAGASWSAVFAFFMVLDMGITTILAVVGYGYRKYGKRELLCFIVAMASVVALRYDPVNAILLAIVGDLFAFYPTIVKTKEEPRSEHVTAWLFITTASILGVLSTEILDTANLAFAGYQVVMNGTVLTLAYFGRRTG